jgi:hypothetical protein
MHFEKALISINNVDDYFYKNRVALSTLKKTKIWVHVPFEVNSRNWSSFGSRNSSDLNFPYIYLCIKSIIDTCGKDHDVIIYDDSNIQDILENKQTEVELEKLSGVLLDKYREISKAEILYHYGGIHLPCSLFMKECPQKLLKPTKNKMIACRVPNEGMDNSMLDFIVSSKILVCKKGCPKMKSYIEYLKILDYSEELFSFKSNEYLKENAFIIDAEYIGGRDTMDKMVTIDRLLSDEHIPLSTKSFGLYLNLEQILIRSKFQWFLRMSPQQIHHSKTRLSIARYIQSSEI